MKAIDFFGQALMCHQIESLTVISTKEKEYPGYGFSVMDVEMRRKIMEAQDEWQALPYLFQVVLTTIHKNKYYSGRFPTATQAEVEKQNFLKRLELYSKPEAATDTISAIV